MSSPLIRVGAKTQTVLDRLSERDGRSRAQIIEEAVLLYFKAHPAKREPAKSRRGRKPKTEEVSNDEKN